MRSKAVEDMLHNRAVEHVESVLSRNCDCASCHAIKMLVKQRDENASELVALRKVADAAVAYRDEDVDDDGEFTTWEPVLMALREAGR